MKVIWGLTVIAIGLMFIVWGRRRSEFLLYRLFVARSRGMWGDRVHGFYQAAGAMMIVVGAVMVIAA